MQVVKCLIIFSFNTNHVSHYSRLHNVSNLYMLKCSSKKVFSSNTLIGYMETITYDIIAYYRYHICVVILSLTLIATFYLYWKD